MTALLRTQENYASVDLSLQWKDVCYRKVLGFAPPRPSSADEKPNVKARLHQPFRITNLLFSVADDDAFQQKESESKHDHWTQTALEIQSNLDTMAQWIRQKRLAFSSVDTMNNQEASLVQSTVTSFTATTANEIESLRKLITPDTSSQHQQLAQHRTGIVQILLSQLKERIAEPFGQLQALRSRKAIQLWQNPMQCTLLQIQSSKKKRTSSDDDLDAVLGLQDGGDEDAASLRRRRRQLFQPQRPTHRLHANFVASYEQDTDDDETEMEQPQSVLFSRSSKRSLPESTTHDNGSSLNQEQQQRKHVRFNLLKPSQPKRLRLQDDNPKMPHEKASKRYDTSTDHHLLPHSTTSVVAPEQLQQEALLLTASLQNDLDSVQKMEQMMVDITTLLSQFADLVSEQSEQVYEIKDATASAKENVQTGQEQLVDAKERTQQSKHYMATAVASMGVLLLFFNWVRP